MVDFKKEIKLSDLVPKRKKQGPAGSPITSRPAAKKKKNGRKQDLVGVKVGASQLAAAEVVNDGSVPRVVKVAREPLEPGVVVSGEVRDAAALGRALDEFFRKYDLPRRNVRLGIGTNRVGVRILDIEGIDDENQLANAVTFRAHEALAIPMDQAVMDYHLVGTRGGNGDEPVSRRVVLAAAHREPIDHFIGAFDAAGIELAGIDVEAFALLRAVAPRKNDREDEQGAVVAVAIGHDRTTLAISNGTICDFTRVLEWGGGRLDATIARELGVTAEEASEIKLGLALDDDDPAAARARAAVSAELTNLARELVASLQFYQAQPDSLALSEILVTGGTTRMSGFVDELERLVRARVRVADPLAAVRAGEDVVGREDLASLSVAIGLGMEV
jgi:type IV pilus assembly protein PilM